MAKTLQIIETAYRATLEEQDDPIVWITHAFKGAGADISVLLRGNAVNYLVKGQDASGLSFGGKKQTQPPKLTEDVVKLTEKGITVFAVSEDLAERGIEASDIVGGVETIGRAGLPKLLAGYERVWHW